MLEAATDEGTNQSMVYPSGNAFLCSNAENREEANNAVCDYV